MSDLGLSQLKPEGFIAEYDGPGITNAYAAARKIHIDRLMVDMPWYLRPFRSLIIDYCEIMWNDALLLSEKMRTKHA